VEEGDPLGRHEVPLRNDGGEAGAGAEGV
jgi:hypothetical protein